MTESSVCKECKSHWISKEDEEVMCNGCECEPLEDMLKHTK